jgi:hypothetical protein
MSERQLDLPQKQSITHHSDELSGLEQYTEITQLGKYMANEHPEIYGEI